MELEIFIRYIHFLCIIAIAGVITAEHLLLQPQMNRGEIKRLAKIDLIYGISAIIMVAAGLAMWFWVGKPAEFYSENWIFHLKVGLAIVLGLISLPPTLFFIKHSKGEPEEMVNIPKHLIMWIRMELLLLVIIPLLAVMMARGVGYFG